MAYEWTLNTPQKKQFLEKRDLVKVVGHNVVVDDDGEPKYTDIEEVEEGEEEVSGLATCVRVRAAKNDKATSQFHIRLIYGRKGEDGSFLPSKLDDGIIIGGPNYSQLDVNQDGLITEDEMLLMCSKLLGWDGELKKLPEEGPA